MVVINVKALEVAATRGTTTADLAAVSLGFDQSIECRS